MSLGIEDILPGVVGSIKFMDISKGKYPRRQIGAIVTLTMPRDWLEPTILYISFNVRGELSGILKSTGGSPSENMPPNPLSFDGVEELTFISNITRSGMEDNISAPRDILLLLPFSMLK
jgi:hypothetical protein